MANAANQAVTDALRQAVTDGLHLIADAITAAFKPIADSLSGILQGIEEIVSAISAAVEKLKSRQPLPRPRKPQAVARQEIRENIGVSWYPSGFT